MWTDYRLMPGAIRCPRRKLPSRPNTGVLIAVQNVRIIRSVCNASVFRLPGPGIGVSDRKEYRDCASCNAGHTKQRFPHSPQHAGQVRRPNTVEDGRQRSERQNGVRNAGQTALRLFG